MLNRFARQNCGWWNRSASGKASNITEGRFSSGIEATIQDKTPPRRVVVAVQAAARMFLAKRRLREATRGAAPESKVHWFYIKEGTTTVKISVFEVRVRRTLKKNVTKTVTEKVRHHVGEAWERDRETQEKTQEIEEQEVTTRIQIEAENQSDISNTKSLFVEKSDLFVTPFLVDHLRKAITLEWDED